MMLRLYFRKFGRAFAFACIILLFSGISFYLIETIFVIRTIEIVSHGVGIEVDQRKIPNNLLFFPTAKMKAELLQDNPLLEDVRFSKHYPSTLRIEFVLRAPIARLKLKDRELLLADTGAVVGVASNEPDLPLITITSPILGLGNTTTDKRILKALEFIRGTRGLFLVEQITEKDSSSVTIKTKQTSIFITQNSDITTVAATLQTMMTGFRIKGALPTTIDLRFRKPVVLF